MTHIIFDLLRFAGRQQKESAPLKTKTHFEQVPLKSIRKVLREQDVQLNMAAEKARANKRTPPGKAHPRGHWARAKRMRS